MTDTKYKLGSIDKKQITAAARKALIAADAHYYAWPTQQQERFRTTMGEDSRNKVRRVLLGSLLDIQCSDEEVDKVWDDIPLPKLNVLNWASLLTSGLGEDYLYLNESMAEGKSLLDFDTLYDYDYDDYLFQEQGKQRDFQNYQGAAYYAYKHPSWVRLLIDGQFYYATFLSLATQLTDDIETAGNDIIEQLIPHKYVAGKDNGKPEKGGFFGICNLMPVGRKIEKGSMIIFFKPWEKGTGEHDADGQEIIEKIPMLRPFIVFNLDQTDGLEVPEQEPLNGGFDPIAAAETVLAASGVTIHETGTKAFYRPSTDEITLSERERFTSAENFYATALHELTRSTKHASRCDRSLYETAIVGGAYAFEELVAELGAAFSMAWLGLHGTVQNHASYIDNWMSVLKADKKAFFRAAAQAQKAHDWIKTVAVPHAVFAA